MNTTKKIALIGLAIASSFSLTAQKEGGISQQMLQKIQSHYKGTSSDIALRNAIAAADIDKLAVNSENQNGFDTHFSHKVSSKGISDQKSSGRCWLFTGLNVFRSKMINKYDMGAFEFSQSYPFFWDQLEKSNLFLQGIIDTRKEPLDDRMVEWLFKHPQSDGGQFTGVADLLMKYGVVPQDVMKDTNSAERTRGMATLIARKLREMGLELREKAKNGTSLKQLEELKTEQLGTIYRILVLNLGEPVKEFTWTLRNSKGEEISTKTYTPKSFYDEFIGEDLSNNYVMLMNDPSRPFDKLYEIDYDRHVYDGKNWTYVNLSIEDLKEIAIASIKDNTMMYFSCDVGKFYDRSRGLLDLNNFDYNSLFDTNFGMDKCQRVQTFDSGSSHAMTLMAVDLDKTGKPKKWMVENSWGPTNGYKGHLIMTDEWFDNYMFRVVVEKKYITDKVQKILKQKPIRLPAWDPMFAPEQ